MGSEAFLQADSVRIEVNCRCWRKLVSGARKPVHVGSRIVVNIFMMKL